MHDDHGHHHEHIEGFESPQQAIALMSYMLDHNRHHASELHELSHRLVAMGKADLADLLDKAVESFKEGNTLLERALNGLREEG